MPKDEPPKREGIAQKVRRLKELQNKEAAARVSVPAEAVIAEPVEDVPDKSDETRAGNMPIEDAELVTEPDNSRGLIQSSTPSESDRELIMKRDSKYKLWEAYAEDFSRNNADETPLPFAEWEKLNFQDKPEVQPAFPEV